MKHLSALFTIAVIVMVYLVIGYDLAGYPKWEVVQAQFLGVIAFLCCRIVLRMYDL